jgi:chemotaxis signal transduction protein
LNDSKTSANQVLANMMAHRGTLDGPTPNQEDHELGWPCLLMRVGKHWFGVRAEHVREVVVPEAITRVPAQPEHVLGVSLVHGRLVPVVDIGKMMANVRVARTGERGLRLAVLTHGESEIGAVADEAKGVIELPAPEPNSVSESAPPYVLGEVHWERQLVILFDVGILIATAIGVE